MCTVCQAYHAQKHDCKLYSCTHTHTHTRKHTVTCLCDASLTFNNLPRSGNTPYLSLPTTPRPDTANVLAESPSVRINVQSSEFLVPASLASSNLGTPVNTSNKLRHSIYLFMDSVANTFTLNPYPTAFPYGNGMVLHFYQQQESSTTKTVHKVINKGLKTYV